MVPPSRGKKRAHYYCLSLCPDLWLPWRRWDARPIPPSALGVDLLSLFLSFSPFLSLSLPFELLHKNFLSVWPRKKYGRFSFHYWSRRKFPVYRKKVSRSLVGNKIFCASNHTNWHSPESRNVAWRFEITELGRLIISYNRACAQKITVVKSWSTIITKESVACKIAICNLFRTFHSRGI